MQNKKVLLFGSGLVSKPVLIYFARFPGYHVSVVTNDKAAGSELVSGFPASASLIVAKVEDRATCLPLVKSHAVVLSLLPANLHPIVAEYCLEAQRHMLTSSYLSPELQKRSGEVAAQGLTFLNEVGLDPGIDHVVTLKMINEVRKRGGKVGALTSLCGGLVTPDCIDNPLGYKFSWSPLGVFRALGNDARFLKGGAVVSVPGEDLLYAAEDFGVNNALNIVKYPNRDSLKYIELYGIPEAKSIFRGTLRYKGFCEIIAAFKELGFLREAKPGKDTATWPDVVRAALGAPPGGEGLGSPGALAAALDKTWVAGLAAFDVPRLVGRLTSNPAWKAFSRETAVNRLNMIFEALVFFGFADPSSTLDPGKTFLENFIDKITPLMTLKSHDSDSVVMTIIVEASYSGNQVREDSKFQMIINGDKGGLSAMAKTVGTPLAIAAKLVLDGKIQRRGVIGPFTPDVYEPLYEELTKLKLIPEFTTRQFHPKL